MEVDRQMAITIALYERYASDKRPPSNTWQGYATASMVLVSFMGVETVTTNDAHMIVDGFFSVSELLKMEGEILYTCGLNLYAATGYDIMNVYLTDYSMIVGDVASTIYQLAYFTTLSRSYNHDEVGMVCIEMGCRFNKVPFKGKSRTGIIRVFQVDMRQFLDIEKPNIYKVVTRGSVKAEDIVRAVDTF